MKVALVELTSSHTECLYSQIKFIKESGHSVYLITIKKATELVKDFDLLDKVIFFDIPEQGPTSLDGIFNFVHAISLNKLLKKFKFDKVIFNTASNNFIRSVCALAPKSIQYLGVLHNTQKLLTSNSQKIISKKVKKYYVLNDYLTENEELKALNNISVQSFYPIFFPDYKPVNINKPDKEIWITIPGSIENNRRDYHFLINKLKNNPPINNIKFILLGNANSKDGQKLLKEIESAGLNNYFITFSGFIDNDTFHSYIKLSDFIIPLIHDTIDDYPKYLKYKITGSINLAFAYRITLLMDKSFEGIPDFNETALFYTDHDFIELLTNLKSTDKRVYRSKKWNFDYQKSNFMNFLTE
ncbi:hypothetical protein OO013_04500 [Mangrovivirga sp. M17]|uniref:Glycosyltransferase n=1 Tax=Mangrovivirga halotolerans TaxID=2993936 RepID=A0ABT3RMR8_9BACT|nr:hypothetical protein [Mangrovivirga halotolerans]MCX2743111.1 hypothetical protein [Mangrovivirga halotolerans]